MYKSEDSYLWLSKLINFQKRNVLLPQAMLIFSYKCWFFPQWWIALPQSHFLRYEKFTKQEQIMKNIYNFICRTCKIKVKSRFSNSVVFILILSKVYIDRFLFHICKVVYLSSWILLLLRASTHISR